MAGNVRNSVAQASAGAATSLASTAINSVTGNTITVFCQSDATINTPTDNAGNTYVARGTLITNSGINSRVYVCENATGNAALVVTFTVSFSANLSSIVVESEGLLSSSFDQCVSALDSSSPYTVTSGTLAQADSHALVFMSGNSATTPATHAESSGFTLPTGSAGEITTGGPDWTCCFGYKNVSATTALTPSLTENGSSTAGVHILILKAAPTFTLEQEGFRWGVDDGNEASHNWEAAQDTSITIAAGARLLRALINATLDPGAIAYALYAQKNGAGGYFKVQIGSSYEPQPVIEVGDITESGNNTASASWAVSVPAAATGDLIIVNLAWDDSTTTTSVTAPSGPNSETFTSIQGPTASNATNVRGQCWYTVATGSWSAGTLTFTPNASEQWTAAVVKVLAGEFDATTPIGASNVLASTAAGNPSTPTLTAGASDGGGTLVHWMATDTDDPDGTMTGWTELVSTDRGATGIELGVRTTAVTDSESISSSTGLTFPAAQSWVSFCYVVRAPTITNEVYISTSSNITAGGEATTARLTAPASKSTSDFVTGRRWDDENGTDTIDITNDDYTELEWSVTLAGSLSNGDFFDFRVYEGTAPLDTYTVTPRWTIGSGALAVNDARNTHTVDNVALTQANTLVVADARNTHTVDNVALTQANTLVVADARNTHTVDNVALTQANTLAVNDARHTHAVDNVALTQANTLAVNDARNTHTVDNVALTQANVLAVAETLHAHTAESPTLSVVLTLVVADARNTHTVDNVTLTQANTLAVNDARHTHAVDNVALTQANTLAVNDARNTHTVDNLNLIQANMLAVNDARNTHTVDNIVLAQANTIATNEALHGHSAENVTLSLADLLVVADARNTHTVDNLNLIQANILSVNDARNTHTVDNIVLSQANLLNVNDARNTHTVDNLNLIQANILSVNDARNTHTVDNLNLIQANTLVVADTLHGHLAESLILLQGHLLLVQDTRHGHLAEEVAFIGPVTLVVNETLHGHLAGLVNLQLPGLSIDLSSMFVIDPVGEILFTVEPRDSLLQV